MLVESRDFYASPILAQGILSGRIPPPEVVSWLCKVVGATEHIDESDLPDTSCVPTATGEHRLPPLLPPSLR